jgi:hypothetical protein
MTKKLTVKTATGRNVLSTGSLFNTPKKTVFEYVLNGIEYRDPNDLRPITINIEAYARKKIIEIKDNGKGMDREDLEHFFQMNADQREEERVISRSQFGTGKSAAFGIGNSLIIDTCRNGKRNRVRLTKEMLRNAEGSSEIPIEVIFDNQDTDQDNGTLVIIQDIQVEINKIPIIKYLERHLSKIKHLNPIVLVNDTKCQFEEINEKSSIIVKPQDEVSKVLGNIELKIIESVGPLGKEDIGISITAGEGKLIAHEKLFLESKEMGNYITGEIDVPCLGEELNGLAAYTQARDLSLNKSRSDCKILVKFLAAETEKFRKELAKKKKAAKESEQGRKLEKTLNEIASVLSETYLSKKNELDKLKRQAFGEGELSKKLADKIDDINGDDHGIFSGGSEINADEEGEIRVGEPKDDPQKPIKKAQKPLKESPDGLKEGIKKPAKNRVKSKGGFRVESANNGIDNSRFHYSQENITITINLDHPSVAQAYFSSGNNPENIEFKRLMYEIAFTGFILGVGQELVLADPQKPADDLRFDMQELYDDVTLKASKLYS